MSTTEKDLGVEVITAYEFRQVGQVFFPPMMLRERLIKLGLVKPVAAAKPGKAKPEARAMAAPMDRMMRSPANK